MTLALELPENLCAALARALGSRVRRASAIVGGDINEAHAVDLEDGRTVFVKHSSRSLPGTFSAEARGLAWLSSARALRVPEVLATSEEPPFLALQFLAPGRPRGDFDEELGRGLAALHRAAPGCFGLDHDNFIGRLPQPNGKRDSWAEFYREQRLGFQLSLAARSGRLTAPMKRGFERLFIRLEDRLGPAEPPARLHGDLWGGNVHVAPDGAPCLIDPAVYGGHREVDLAMMRLFGGFSSRCFRAYEEAYPLSPGAEERMRLYQLYPLLVHLNLFGGSYGASVEETLRACS